jgi:5'-nucleotidase
MRDYISVTPMRPDLTCHASLAGLRGALEEG